MFACFAVCHWEHHPRQNFNRLPLCLLLETLCFLQAAFVSLSLGTVYSLQSCACVLVCLSLGTPPNTEFNLQLVCLSLRTLCLLLETLCSLQAAFVPLSLGTVYSLQSCVCVLVCLSLGTPPNTEFHLPACLCVVNACLSLCL
jgi:hypothetical protein